MNKAESRIQKTRSFQGEELVEPLAYWLNRPSNKAGRDRIERILGLYEEAAINWEPAGVKSEFRGDKAEWLAEYNRMIEEAMSYYTLVPKLVVHFRPNGPYRTVSLAPAPGSKLARACAAAIRSKSGVDAENEYSHMTEVDAFLHAIDLIKSKNCWKLGLCLSGQPRCGKFFFRKFKHQRFCSEKCRIAEFRDSDEARARRNEYARNLYQLHKSGNVK